MADLCPPLAGCDMADVPYCVMLGATCDDGGLLPWYLDEARPRARSIQLQAYAAHVRQWRRCSTGGAYAR